MVFDTNVLSFFVVVVVFVCLFVFSSPSPPPPLFFFGGGGGGTLVNFSIHRSHQFNKSVQETQKQYAWLALLCSSSFSFFFLLFFPPNRSLP